MIKLNEETKHKVQQKEMRYEVLFRCFRDLSGFGVLLDLGGKYCFAVHMRFYSFFRALCGTGRHWRRTQVRVPKDGEKSRRPNNKQTFYTKLKDTWAQGQSRWEETKQNRITNKHAKLKAWHLHTAKTIINNIILDCMMNRRPQNTRKQTNKHRAEIGPE